MNLLKWVFILLILSVETATANEKNIMKERFTIEERYLVKPAVTFSEELNQTIHIGYTNTSGNTDNLNLNGEYDLGVTLNGCHEKPLRIGFNAVAFLNENKGIKDNEEYRIHLGLEQNIWQEWLGYVTGNWLHNAFKNYQQKISLGGGVGRLFFEDATRKLTLKLGLAHNHYIYSNKQESDQFTSLNEYLEYENKLTPLSKFFVQFGTSQNLEDFNNDYELLALIGIKATIIEALSISLQEELAYDHLPAVGFKQTDTKTMMRLGYAF